MWKVCLITAMQTVCALAAGTATEVLLWPGGAPGSEQKDAVKEVVNGPHAGQDFTRVWSIHRPALLVYLPPPDKASGAAMIIAPGGGHRFLSLDMEGTNLAKPLNDVGAAVFVLKYRLAREEGSSYRVEVEALADMQRAIRTVRARAQEWRVNPTKVGVMGFSAGGELAALVSTRFDKGIADAPDPIEHQVSRPDYQVLIYPGIRAEDIHVTADSPPAFLLCAANDKGPAAAIPELYLALKKAGVPAEMHIYLTGGHGFGLRDNPKPGFPVYTGWVPLLQNWMTAVGMSTH